MPDAPRLAALEAGGTKFVCGVGSSLDELRASRISFPTGDEPAVVIGRVIEFFRSCGPVAGVGIASFGPVDLDESSPTFGFITSTPKRGWTNTDLVGPIRAALGVPVGFDTDVNGAALGEHHFGAARGLDDFLYLTIGTGVGGGGMARGRLLHGLVHPEVGHIRLPRETGDDFAGVCPFHGDCWEGLCSGPAIAARTGVAAEDLPADHPAWPQVCRYVGVALANLVCTLSPKRILIGGSVRKAGAFGERAFFAGVRAAMRDALNGYVVARELARDDYVTAPELGDDAGLCGAFALAQLATDGARMNTDEN